jgi:hypothetical protein
MRLRHGGRMRSTVIIDRGSYSRQQGHPVVVV